VDIFTAIKTDRLLIRILNMQDKDDFFAYRSMPEVYQYQGWRPVANTEAEDFINKNISICPNTPNTWLQLAICLKGGTLIGDIGVHFLEDGFQAEIGYTLSPAYQGNGYAIEAVKGVMGYLFIGLLKHRVIASIDPDNTRSAALLERLGFQKEAHFRKSCRIEGKWLDDCIYAMLEEDWILK
jgi:RimJ/RimL family protein N-acetyltransferase